MSKLLQIHVTSVSFYKNTLLRQEILRRFPKTVFHEGHTPLSGRELAFFLKDAEGVIVGREAIDDELLSQCPQLQIVAKYGVGLDNIDQEACRKRGVVVGWTGGVNRRSVAELTLCFLIGMSRNVFYSAQSLREGKWNKNGGVQLSNRNVGIIGLGNIGKEVCRLLKPFGCKIYANDLLDMREYCLNEGLIFTDKDTIYKNADILSLHIPLTDLTRNLINRESLSKMRNPVQIINTSRGEVVVESALKIALQKGEVSQAALDVFIDEPPEDLEFLSLPNLIATAHIGGNALEAVLAMGQSAIDHLTKHFS